MSSRTLAAPSLTTAAPIGVADKGLRRLVSSSFSRPGPLLGNFVGRHSRYSHFRSKPPSTPRWNRYAISAYVPAAGEVVLSSSNLPDLLSATPPECNESGAHNAGRCFVGGRGSSFVVMSPRLILGVLSPGAGRVTILTRSTAWNLLTLLVATPQRVDGAHYSSGLLH